MQTQEVPLEHQAEYASLIEQLSHFALEIDNKLPMYLFVLKSEDAVKKLIAIVCVIYVSVSFALLIVNCGTDSYCGTTKTDVFCREHAISHDHRHATHHDGTSPSRERRIQFFPPKRHERSESPDAATTIPFDAACRGATARPRDFRYDPPSHATTTNTTNATTRPPSFFPTATTTSPTTTSTSTTIWSATACPATYEEIVDVFAKYPAHVDVYAHAPAVTSYTGDECTYT